MPERKGLDIESLKEIIKIMKENDVAELSIEQGGLKIHVKQLHAQQLASVSYTTPVPIAHEVTTHAISPESAKKDAVYISAPMVGTFYRAPSPDAEPYVEVGSEVKAGQVICIIEAMKLMNEISADMDCTILEILVDNGQAVEYDQPIFRVKPKA